MRLPIPQVPEVYMPQIFPEFEPPSISEAAMQAVVMSEETPETTVDPETLDPQIVVAGIKTPAEKSNIIFFALIAVVILIIWRP